MTALGLDLAETLDPVRMAQRLGTDPDPWQAQAIRSAAPRSALNVHRQGGKSEVARIKALHQAVYRPGSTVVVASPSQRQSLELFRRITAGYGALGRPIPVVTENLSTLELANGSRILALPGDPETIRGIPAVHLLVIDEASRVSDELFTAVSPMLATTGGQLLAISTPAGRRGWWFKAVTEAKRNWQVTTVRASESTRLAPEFLAQERDDMPELDYRQEYECEFVEGAGSLFSADDVLAAVQPAPLRFNPEAERGSRLSLVDEVA